MNNLSCTTSIPTKRWAARLGSIILLSLFSAYSFAGPISGNQLTTQLGIENGGAFIVHDSVTFEADVSGLDSPGPSGITSIDADNTSISLLGLNIGFSTDCCSFNGYRIFDTANLIDDFLSVSINLALTTNPNFIASQLSFTADEIRLDWIGASTGAGSGNIVLDITTGSAVPTPATLALFGLGLAGLGWSTRKKA